ncbi:MAG: hypothetical protein M1828_001615 [Chrysothrix sp. TS-e1954]|nr:MAG: hypothetical protein M1828_001615 [Chrysothrix sp. TS-e1954]
MSSTEPARRHIRCDESFPQCRNCTKHQVRCDYNDNAANEDTSSRNSPAFSVLWSMEVEQSAQQWSQTGKASLGNIVIDLDASRQRYSRSDLRMLHVVLERCQSQESEEFTIQNHMNSRTLAIASSHAFLMHAMMGFTASSMAFERDSAEAKSLAYHHRGVALQGLLAATQELSAQNVDAVLLASILLGWQAVDWQGWLTFIRGIQTVVAFTRAYGGTSAVPHVTHEQEMMIPKWFPITVRPPATEVFFQQYVDVLQRIDAALERLLAYTAGREQDSTFVERLIDYIRRLQAAKPAHTPEEQFNHMHTFRKWLFWVPPMMLGSSSVDEISLIVLAYLYATALQLEPIFPNVAAVFCSHSAVDPLRNVVSHIDRLSRSSPDDARLGPIVSLLAWPKHALATYNPHTQQDAPVRYHPPEVESLAHDFSTSIESQSIRQHASPAFGLSTGISRAWSNASSTMSDSTFLDVPQHMTVGQASGYAYASGIGPDVSYIARSDEQDFGEIGLGLSEECVVSTHMLWT